MSSSDPVDAGPPAGPGPSYDPPVPLGHPRWTSPRPGDSTAGPAADPASPAPVRPPEAAQSLPGSPDTVATSVRAPDQPVASVDAASQLPGDGRPVGPATSAQPGDVLPAPASPARAPANRSFLSELPFLVVVAFLLALLIKAFLVQAFYIPSGSMQQTLEIRDRVLVNKLVYDFRDIRRGEVVVFNGLDSFTQETVVAPPANGFQRVLRTVGGAIGLGVPGEKDFIKRVIGVPGDRVACCTDGKVTVQPQGAPEPVVLAEDYLFEDSAEAFCAAGLGDGSCPVGAEGILVPEGRLWVMGDHRSRSSDSRAHISDANSGTVPQDKVIGRAFVIVWPLDRARLLSVPDTFDGVVALGALPAAALSSTPYALGLIGALPVLALRRRLTGRRARAAAGPAALRG